MTIDSIWAEAFAPFQTLLLAERAKYSSICHYTSSATASAIIKEQHLWLSNVRTMNDWSEIIGGAQILFDTYNSNKSEFFTDYHELRDEIRDAFISMFSEVEHDTYAFCFSGCQGSESETGRLGMWRAYGADGDGVCLVLNKELLLRDYAEDFPLHWSPMIYETKEDFSDRCKSFFAHISGIVSQNKATLSAIPREDMVRSVAHIFMTIALSHKNVAFSDEREIRYIHMKNFAHVPENSGFSYGAATAGNRLRPIFKLKIQPYVDGRLGGHLRDILEGIVVGPSAADYMQAKALEFELANAGLASVPVKLSGIPYISPK